MTMNALLSAALMLIGASPGALSSSAQLRGADTAAEVLDIVDHEDGPLASSPIDKYASEGHGVMSWLSKQGDRDNNCNPCYCNPKAKINSKKQCRADYTCLQHKCLHDETGLGGKCQEGTNGSSCCFKDEDCGPGKKCENRVCSNKGKMKTQTKEVDLPVGKGEACSVIDGPICEAGLSCSGGICVQEGISVGRRCGNLDICAQGLICDNGVCRSKIRRRGDTCNVQLGDTCPEGFKCINGFCLSPSIPYGGSCGAGDTCAEGLQCVGGTCGGRWYVDHSKHNSKQYCVMDCPVRSGPCCGGTAPSWDNPKSSVDECCQDSSVSWKHGECVEQSMSCLNLERNE